jgi:ATP-dependent exoDNAse (exonuclease V) alpha subunit
MVTVMAIYHFSAKVISRAKGSSAIASAAYRGAERLYNERLGRHHDFSNKAGVVHSEVMLPEGAPERLNDRETLWNEVEASEKRKDAQLAREVEFSIPRELDQQEGIRLARDFVQKEFVDRGMVADLNVHWDYAEDGSPKPHAHVMLAMREVGPEGSARRCATGTPRSSWSIGARHGPTTSTSA